MKFTKNDREHGIMRIIEVSTYDIHLLLVKLILIDAEWSLRPISRDTSRKETLMLLSRLLDDQRKKLLKKVPFSGTYWL